MKYLLLIHMNPQTWESLSEAEHNEVFTGHPGTPWWVDR